METQLPGKCPVAAVTGICELQNSWELLWLAMGLRAIFAAAETKDILFKILNLFNLFRISSYHGKEPFYSAYI